MNHQLHSHLISHRRNFFQEEDQVRTKFLSIDIIITIQCFLKLFYGETFFRSRKSGNHITNQQFLIVFTHLFETGFCFGYFFRSIVFLRIRTFQNKEVESKEGRPLKAKSFRAVRHCISKVRTCPVQYRHEVIGNYHYTTFGQITDAFLIVFNIFQEITGLCLDMFVHRYTFYNRPSQAHFFNHLLTLHDFFYCPHFAVRNVMKCVYYTGSACLFNIPQAYWVIRTIPAPSLFT